MSTKSVLIEWTDDLSVNVPSIDEQHKKLVNMINALNSAMEDGETDDVLVKIFEGLLAYTDKHFKYEEGIFAKIDYVATDAHQKEHDDLRAKVTEMKERLDKGEFMLGVEVMSFLRDWLTNHIMGSDKAYSAHLVKAGIR